MSLTNHQEIGRVGRGCYEETPADVEFRLNHTMCLRGCGWARTSLLLVVVLQTSWLAREISSAWSLSNWTRRSPSSPASKLRPTTANSRSVRLAVCLSVRTSTRHAASALRISLYVSTGHLSTTPPPSSSSYVRCRQKRPLSSSPGYVADTIHFQHHLRHCRSSPNRTAHRPFFDHREIHFSTTQFSRVRP